MQPVDAVMPLSELELSNRMHQLWNDNIQWTRETILNTANNSPYRSDSIERLNQNTADFTRLYGQMYGPQAGANLGNFVAHYNETTVDLMDAIQTGDMEVTQDLRTQWYDNVNRSLMFLSEVNPYYDSAALQVALYELLNFTTYEIMQLLSSQYRESIVQYDLIEAQARDIADTLIAGYLAQRNAPANG